MMTGTNNNGEAEVGPAVILVKPQLAENIGMVARAMLNCGLTDLRLAAPRDGWPNVKARRAASGADIVIDNARVFENAAEAVADLNKVYAATARLRDMIKPMMTPRQGALDMQAAIAGGATVGVLFGSERAGLDNDDVTLADTLLNTPLNPEFHSLNLSQAVLLMAYEWYQLADRTPSAQMLDRCDRLATKGELVNFFERLEAALDKSGFFHVREKRPIMVRNIRNMFQRAGLMQQEVRTLHGMVSRLSDPDADELEK